MPCASGAPLRFCCCNSMCCHTSSLARPAAHGMPALTPNAWMLRACPHVSCPWQCLPRLAAGRRCRGRASSWRACRSWMRPAHVPAQRPASHSTSAASRCGQRTACAQHAVAVPILMRRLGNTHVTHGAALRVACCCGPQCRQQAAPHTLLHVPFPAPTSPTPSPSSATRRS